MAELIAAAGETLFGATRIPSCEVPGPLRKPERPTINDYDFFPPCQAILHRPARPVSLFTIFVGREAKSVL